MALLPTIQGRPKIDLIHRAYGICGIAEDSLTPEDMSLGLSTLNFMMMDLPWSKVDYAQPTSGEGDVGDQSGLLNDYAPAVIYELAMRLAPDIGKTLSSEAIARARTTKRSFEALIAEAPALSMRGGVHLGRGRQRGYYQYDPYSVNE